MDLEVTAPRPGRLKTWLGVAPAVVVVLLALWEAIAVVRSGSDVPAAADWDRATAFVRAHHAPGQLIVFAPEWIDPVGRMHAGDLIDVAMAARMDAARFGVIWEMSARGASAPETAGLTPVLTRRFGDLTVRRFEQSPAEVVYDFVAQFSAAGISGPAAGRPHVSLEEVGFEPHRCVRVEPRPDQTVTVTYPSARLGQKLVGYVGLADVFTRRDIRDPGRLEVAINGTKVAVTQVGVDSGWVKFSAATAPSPSARVTFSATAVGPHARDRLICFAAEARADGHARTLRAVPEDHPAQEGE
ncbi:MAG TPA: hypothetical protein VFG83_19490 [Kofleriaceae bacterium]|nr:hypothetical protein [Kofleriaceae bacterium]